ncbi:MAG: hypothetical protein ACFFDN_16945, partial [Candidatus Hodarchaeota archaeon]
MDKGDICSVCKNYDHLWGNWEQEKNNRLSKLENIIDKIKKKRRLYDVLVPISGGKDSTYVLYLCRKRFDLKCLAVTWDNGFLSDHARINIKNACDLLGVDHMYFGLNKQLLMSLYKFFFQKTGFFCPVCMRGIGVTIGRAQIAFNIPLAIRGTSHRTEEHVSSEFFIDGNINFFENVLKGSSLEKKAQVLLTPIGLAFSPSSIKLPDYMEWNYEEVYKTITEELGWRAPKKDAEHADCKLENIVAHIRYKKFPILTPEMLRFSKLVTCGQMTRIEAEQKVAEKKNSIKEPYNMEWFLNSFGINRDDFIK